MCEKIGLRLFPIRFHASDEEGAEVRGRCRHGGILGHNSSVVTAKDLDALSMRGKLQERQGGSGKAVSASGTRSSLDD